MLVRKADWHDEDGMRLLLSGGADPNVQPRFGVNAMQQSLRRDNRLSSIELLLNHGGDPALRSNRDGRSTLEIAARRGRADALELFEQRGIRPEFGSFESLVAACARADQREIGAIVQAHPDLSSQILSEAGSLLAEFAGNGNANGLRCLLALGSPVGALYEGDGYFDIAPASTALHVAAWRAQPKAVSLLIERGASVNVADAKGRTPLQLAVRACVDSYWMNRRTPDCVAALLNAGASSAGIELPTGYQAIDRLLEAQG